MASLVPAVVYLSEGTDMPVSKRWKPKDASRHQPTPSLRRFLGMAHFREQNPRCTVTFPFDDETCIVTYKPTGPLLSELQRLANMRRGTGMFAALARLLASHIVEWNLELEGKPVPITDEAIIQLQARWLLKTARAIAADLSERLQRYADEMKDSGSAGQEPDAS